MPNHFQSLFNASFWKRFKQGTNQKCESIHMKCSVDLTTRLHCRPKSQRTPMCCCDRRATEFCRTEGAQALLVQTHRCSSQEQTPQFRAHPKFFLHLNFVSVPTTFSCNHCNCHFGPQRMREASKSLGSPTAREF